MRRCFFGPEASTEWSRRQLKSELPDYRHNDADVHDQDALVRIIAEYGSDIDLTSHTAVEPSRDWAAQEPLTDFSVNATVTLICLR